MAEITKKIIREKNLTIFTVTGVFSPVPVIEALEEMYRTETTLNLIWDISAADVSRVDDTQVQQILNIAKQYSSRRKNGKTAIVADKTLNFGMARMYEITAEVSDHPILHAVFKNLEDAVEWLER